MTEIRTRLKRGHIIRQVVIAVVCIVLGLWGVYDYIWTIPQQQAAHDRYLICQSVVEVLESEPVAEGYSEKLEDASTRITTELDALVARANKEHGPIENAVPPANEQEALQQRVDELKKTIETLGEQGDDKWFMSLAMFRQAILTPRPPVTSQEKLTGIHAAAWEVATQGVNYFAEVTPPHKYDRVMKGLVFIPCLPIGLYMLFALMLQSRKVHSIDEEGNLHLPGGRTWKPNEIKEIDMNRWMSKSVARVKHADGTIAKLDDYIFQDTHLVVGAIAHRFHPEEWTSDARSVKVMEEKAADDAARKEIEREAEAEKDVHA